MAGRASIVGAAATHVGKVREHNEDAHYLDVDSGVFVVCDGMGGHAAGEVASALAIRTLRAQWESPELGKHIAVWLTKGSPDAKKQLIGALRSGVTSAHQAILSEAAADESKSGMGTTLIGGVVVGNELVFAHAGDSRAYMVRDGIAMQLTEDHTLLARLLAAGIDVDVSGEGARFRSMLTNALGIGQECKVATFVVPLADGDRFLLCSDGISEYVPEAEVGTVLTSQPSPARAAQKLIELALERGGADNATAVVIRVLEAGETPRPAEERRREEAIIEGCPIWGERISAQQRLRAMRITIPRDFPEGERLPAHTLGDRVAWILLEGEIEIDGVIFGPGAFLYPESLVASSPPREKDALGVTRTEIRALAFRADDFRELCDEDNELGEALLEALAPLVSKRKGRTTVPAPLTTSTTLPAPLGAATPVVPGESIIPGIPAPTPHPEIVNLAPKGVVLEDEIAAPTAFLERADTEPPATKPTPKGHATIPFTAPEGGFQLPDQIPDEPPANPTLVAKPMAGGKIGAPLPPDPLAPKSKPAIPIRPVRVRPQQADADSPPRFRDDPDKIAEGMEDALRMLTESTPEEPEPTVPGDDAPAANDDDFEAFQLSSDDLEESAQPPPLPVALTPATPLQIPIARRRHEEDSVEFELEMDVDDSGARPLPNRSVGEDTVVEVGRRPAFTLDVDNETTRIDGPPIVPATARPADRDDDEPEMSVHVEEPRSERATDEVKPIARAPEPAKPAPVPVKPAEIKPVAKPDVKIAPVLPPRKSVSTPVAGVPTIPRFGGTPVAGVPIVPPRIGAPALARTGTTPASGVAAVARTLTPPGKLPALPSIPKPAGASGPTAVAIPPPPQMKIEIPPVKVESEDGEIETYFEMDADDPPAASDPDPDHEEMTVSHEDDSGRVVTATMTDSEAHTVELTVTKQMEDMPTRPVMSTLQDSVLSSARPPLRTRTSAVMAAVSGTISVPAHEPESGVVSQPLDEIESIPVPAPRLTSSDQSEVEIRISDIAADDDEPDPDKPDEPRPKRVSEGW